MVHVVLSLVHRFQANLARHHRRSECHTVPVAIAIHCHPKEERNFNFGCNRKSYLWAISCRNPPKLHRHAIQLLTFKKFPYSFVRWNHDYDSRERTYRCVHACVTEFDIRNGTRGTAELRCFLWCSPKDEHHLQCGCRSSCDVPPKTKHHLQQCGCRSVATKTKTYDMRTNKDNCK